MTIAEPTEPVPPVDPDDRAGGEEPPGDDQPAEEGRADAEAGDGGIGGWLRWLVRRPTRYGGFVGALLLFWISLTPSLLPRPWFAQAAVSGIAAAIGFGLGSAVSVLVHKVIAGEPSPGTTRVAWRVLIVVAVLGSALLLWWSKGWQNELRRLMGIDEEPDLAVLALLALALLVASLVLLGARLVRSFSRFVIRQIDRVLPRRASVPIGLALAVFVIVGFAQGFLWRGTISAMNGLAGTANESTTDGTTRPESALRSGSTESLADWDTLGRMGRDFVGRGPSVADLEDFHGPGCCLPPIRVYVGLDTADTLTERAELAVEELERTGAFERSVIGVFNATGTGWINPRVADSFDYLHRGDSASVSIQYSFLPSWLSFLVDQTVAAEAGSALIDAVTERLDAMPEADRPRLLIFGESLGSFATEQAFGDIESLREGTDGVLLVGPTFSNPLWRDLVEGRKAGSPQWRPDVTAKGVRFARTPADLEGFAEESPGTRVVYLQNSSDPITWWSSDLLYRKPDWAGSPAAPDRAPAFRWYPIVTFWQVVADLTDSLGVPTGYGHHFGSNVVDGWVAVSAPAGWTDADTARLKAVVGERG